MSKPRIAVIGDLILDHYFFGKSDRISPEAPIPVVKYSGEEYVLGGAGNVVRNLKSLGSDVVLFGIVGDDKNGEKLIELLQSINVGGENIVMVSGRPTTIKSRIKVLNHQIVRLDIEDESPISEDVEEVLLTNFEENIRLVDLVILSDYAKGLLTRRLLEGVIKMCKKYGIKVLVDPKGVDFAKYNGIFFSTPNKHEASLATGIEIGSMDSLKRAINILKEVQGTDIQIVTLGAEGIALSYLDELRVLPALATEVFDVTGAGDTVIASLGFVLALGGNMEEAVSFANKAASIVVKKPGSATATIAEVEGLDQRVRSTEKIFLDLAELPNEFYNNLSKYKVVFTNGCFDILHSGHVTYLEIAAQLGDLLIVGLNSDASVQRLKGEKRPFNSEKDRAKILSALSFVDYVIIFDEDTPIELIKALKPHTLVKGGDYEESDIIGRDLVNETIVLPFVEGQSSSSLIEKLRNE